MKKITITLSALLLLLGTSCQVESVNADDFESASKKPQTSSAPEAVVNPEEVSLGDLDTDNPCVSVNLIAGQHHVAGDVSVYNDGEHLFVIFSSNGQWTLGTTHLSLGNCEDDWVPLNGAGNPQIGQFPFTEPISATEYEVVYAISLESLGDNYCFAAHAEVEGPTGGETAWAEGAQFDGNSWAMFVEASLLDCPDTATEDPTDGGEDDGDDEAPIPS
ncbi:hypothetical protein [Mangrovimonas sp. YM274]|uniref:hypothetical protein n=1 Tax=Mangrovimonas sp. YM274 TaxID=3070660 RepID=UPI0027DE5298|nr:hypothetical protein [Mangrovimonas sp. YM274]WMI69215.1 hypothetical protein RBH95_02300 [Mangrovimonas sp. YM274]